jgi:hypothetical protein
MENAFERPVPQSVTERVVAAAYDLAWASVNLGWSVRLEPDWLHFSVETENETEKAVFRLHVFVPQGGAGDNRPLRQAIYDKMGPIPPGATHDDVRARATSINDPKSPLSHYLNKWLGQVPDLELFSVLGYVSRYEHPKEQGYSPRVDWTLTEKAFALLERPATEPDIFISYNRRFSTTFALYLEARLRVAGNTAVFIDKSLEPGSDWRETLKQRVAQSKYVVILIDEGTFDSKNVLDEVQWALASDATVIPLLHHQDEGGGPSKGSLKDYGLGHLHAIQASDRTAKGYESAANELLNFLGYATY